MAESKNIIPESKILHETLFTEFKGKEFLPDILHQNDYFTQGTIVTEENGQCGSLSAVETMQAKLNLRSLRQKEQAPPNLSVQHLVDAHTPKPRDYMQTVLNYLVNEGIVSAEEYMVAQARGDGTHHKNVEGLTRHKIISSTNCYCGPTNRLQKSKKRRALNDFTAFGPVIGDMLVTRELLHYTGGIIQGRNYAINKTTDRVLSHAATIIGFGITTNHTLYWVMRNNWGRNYGKKGIFRIIMDLVTNVYSVQVHVNETPVQVAHPNNLEEADQLQEPVPVRKSPRRSARTSAS